MKDAFKARVFTFLGGGGKANIYDFEVNQLGPFLGSVQILWVKNSPKMSLIPSP